MKKDELDAAAKKHAMDPDAFLTFGQIFNKQVNGEGGTHGQAHLCDLARSLLLQKSPTPSTFSPELVEIFNETRRKRGLLRVQSAVRPPHLVKHRLQLRETYKVRSSW